MSERPKCVDICPLVSNATGPINTRVLGFVDTYFDFPVVERSITTGERKVAVRVADHYSQGISVNPNSTACDRMIELYGLDKGQSGGTLSCKHTITKLMASSFPV